VFPTNEFAMKVGAGLKTIECLCNYHYYSISRISVIPNYNTEYSLIRTFDSLEKAKNYFSKINGLMAII
jgi:hypothetical protein